ncbi:MAG: hypothetical protein ACRCYY_16655 [Trueperaceae bacterium]
MKDLVKMSVYLPHTVLADLRYWAEVEKKAPAVLCREMLEAAVRQRASAAGSVNLIPEINKVIDQRFTEFTNKTSYFLAKTFLESATATNLLLEIASKDETSVSEVESIRKRAWEASLNSLDKKTEEIQNVSRRLRDGLL